MYTVHLRLIGKLVIDFLFVLIELFSLGVMAEVLRSKLIGNRRFRRALIGQFRLNFHIVGDVPREPFLHG